MKIEKFKMRVNPSQSEVVQKVLFENGYKWKGTDDITKISYTTEPFLYFSDYLEYGIFEDTFENFYRDLPVLTFKQFKDKYMKIEEYPEYYEFVDNDEQDFTKGKIYKIKDKTNLEAWFNFINDEGYSDGFAGENYLYFIPSTKEAFDEQNKPKELKIEDLIKGEYYSVKDNYGTNWIIIFDKVEKGSIFTGDCMSKTDFYRGGRWGESNEVISLRLATSEERQHLDVCIKTNRFIPNIACSSWKKTIEDYAKRNVFGTSVELTNNEVEAMYKAATSEQVKVLNKYLKRPVVDRNAFIKDFGCDNLYNKSEELFGDLRVLQIAVGEATSEETKGRALWVHDDYEVQVHPSRISGTEIVILKR